MTNLLKLSFILSLSFFCFNGFSQDSRSVEKRKKELIEQEEQRKAEDEAAIKEMHAGHMAIQTKETRKRMKKSKRKANKVNKNKKQFSIRRLFSR